jgi:4-diphosphocytidyl-2-C-methyl-D-erythritol kinase
VEKRIPVGAGMGGGSSDAATTIMALEKLYGVNLDDGAKMEAGFAVGADVPFFFARGPAFIAGIGEKVEPVDTCEKVWLVVVHPGVFLSTAAVFSRFNIELTRGRRLNTIACFDFQGLAQGLLNDLEVPATQLEPSIGAALSALDRAGAAASLMTGSGSACFGLFPGEREARGAEERISSGAGPGWFVKAVQLLAGPGDYPQDE